MRASSFVDEHGNALSLFGDVPLSAQPIHDNEVDTGELITFFTGDHAFYSTLPIDCSSSHFSLALATSKERLQSIITPAIDLEYGLLVKLIRSFNHLSHSFLISQFHC